MKQKRRFIDDKYMWFLFNIIESSNLRNRYYYVIKSRLDGESYQKIGKDLDISRQRVCDIENEALFQIKSRLYKRSQKVGGYFIEWSRRVDNCFMKVGIQRLGDLLQYREKELLKIKGFGLKSLNEIKEKLLITGLKLKE